MKLRLFALFALFSVCIVPAVGERYSEDNPLYPLAWYNKIGRAHV